MVIRRKWITLALVVVILACVAAVVTVKGLSWRARLIFVKAQGNVPGVTWAEMFRMMRSGGGYNLEDLLLTQNPNASIKNPHVSKRDVDAGARLYSAQCATCHERDRGGNAAPDLVHDNLRHVRGDWSIYRVLKYGITGTGMLPQPLSDLERWRVIAYLDARRREAAAVEQPPPVAPIDVSFSQLVAAEGDPAQWLMYSGTYDGHRYSRLTQITTRNVDGLRPVWLFQLPINEEKNESSPLVVGSTMYVTGSGGSAVWALDARSGKTIWHYEPRLPERISLCCGPMNRGVAILDSTLYLGTLDARLVALDARTGTVRWNVEVADARSGYSITSAPLVIRGRVITGVGGGEFGARGVIDAYDAASGRRIWRFEAVPPPGSPGNDSWGGNSWRTGSAPTWLTGSYDAQQDVIYWGVGNPGPDFTREGRSGDNLYSNSVVALDAETGRLRWYFQFTPADDHDWDATQIPILLDAPYGGAMRRLLLWANRNAFYYVLDRDSGTFLRGVPFETQTWAEGLDSAGRPIRRPNAAPSDSGTFLYPSVTGGTSWWSPTYSPRTKLLYVPAMHMAGWFFVSGDAAADRRSAELFTRGAGTLAYAIPFWPSVKALEPTTGQIRWEHRLPTSTDATVMGGLLSTAGGLVFGGAGSLFFALDAQTGRKLWELNVGARITAAPIAYLLDGEQRIALVAGRTLLVFGLPGHRPPVAAPSDSASSARR